MLARCVEKQILVPHQTECKLVEPVGTQCGCSSEIKKNTTT